MDLLRWRGPSSLLLQYLEWKAGTYDCGGLTVCVVVVVIEINNYVLYVFFFFFTLLTLDTKSKL